MATRSIRYDRESKDFLVEVDGNPIGYAKNYHDGECMADDHIFKLLSRDLAPAPEPEDAPSGILAELDTRAELEARIVDIDLRLAARQPANAPALRTWRNRVIRALTLLSENGMPVEVDGVWRVYSHPNTYHVSDSADGCDCPHGQRGLPCKHMELVAAAMEAQGVAV